MISEQLLKVEWEVKCMCATAHEWHVLEVLYNTISYAKATSSNTGGLNPTTQSTRRELGSKPAITSLLLHDFDSRPTVEQRKGWWRHSHPCRDNLRIVWMEIVLTKKLNHQKGFELSRQNKSWRWWFGFRIGRRQAPPHNLPRTRISTPSLSAYDSIFFIFFRRYSVCWFYFSIENIHNVAKRSLSCYGMSILQAYLVLF